MVFDLKKIMMWATQEPNLNGHYFHIIISQGVDKKRVCLKMPITRREMNGCKDRSELISLVGEKLSKAAYMLNENLLNTDKKR